MSPRIPGTFARSQWALAPNPEYAGMSPRPMKAACHDGTPFITIVCTCGTAMHQHEGTFAAYPPEMLDEAEVASVCKGCGKQMVFPPGFFPAAFKQLRDEGWVLE